MRGPGTRWRADIWEFIACSFSGFSTACVPPPDETANCRTNPTAEFCRIVLPGIVRMFFNTLLNFGDTFCAGLLGTDALAALSLSFPPFSLLVAVGSGFQITLKPQILLEGFRPRRIVRLLSEKWPLDDLPWEEMLWPADNRVK